MTHLTPPEAGKLHRLIFLDGIRGWAAMIVLLSHIVFHFLSKTNEIYRLKAFAFFLNGSFAVHVFFVLSGFALSIKFIEKPGYYSLAQAVCARYFRLCIPIFAVACFAWLMLHAGLFFNAQAAIPGATEWLGKPYQFEPTIRSLFEFSFYRVFFRYEELISYNSSLWTMPFEWAGSILVYFILAVFSPKSAAEKRGKIHIVPLVLLSLYFLRFSELLACCIFGYALAEIYHRYRDEKRRIVGIAATALFFVPVVIVTFQDLDRGRYMAVLATWLVACVMFSPPLKVFFSTRLSEFLGRISFPLYLVHILVICSFSSYLFLELPKHGFGHLALSNIILISTIALSLLLAWMLLPLERFSIFAARAISAKILKPTVNQ